ncbi:hypothetical protein V6Z12_A10G178600 [Gossypium hirsutum]
MEDNWKPLNSEEFRDLVEMKKAGFESTHEKILMHIDTKWSNGSKNFQESFSISGISPFIGLRSTSMN